MSACARSCRDLPLFIGGDLDALRAAEVSAHLRDCPSCRREAVALQQPLKHLQELATPAVDDAMFATMRSAIAARLETADVARPAPVAGLRSWAAVAAAAALFVVGWCWVERPAAPAALGRAPIATPVGHPDPARVVPYAGDRVPVPLRPLGDDEVGDRGGAGLMWRWRLHALVDGDLGALPPADEPDTVAPK